MSVTNPPFRLRNLTTAGHRRRYSSAQCISEFFRVGGRRWRAASAALRQEIAKVAAVDRMAVMPDRFAGDWPVILKLAHPLGAAARAPEAR